MVNLSVQAQALLESWNAQQNHLTAVMIRQADHLLEDELRVPNGGDPYVPGHIWSPSSFNLIFNEGVLMVFGGDDWSVPNAEVITWPEADAYRDITEELGNEDDEAIIASNIWCYVLSRADYAKYQPIITKLLDIAANGL